MTKYEKFSMYDAKDLTRFAPSSQMNEGSVVGETLLELYQGEGKNDAFLDKKEGSEFGIFAESLDKELRAEVPDLFTEAGTLVMGSGTANQNALTTVLVANFIERRIRPTLLNAGIMRVATGFNVKGATGIKIPINALQAAGDLPDNGVLTAASKVTSENYSYTQIDLGWKYAFTRLTVQTMHSASADVIADSMGLMGDAISRQIDYDIVTALRTACPYNTTTSTWSNGNGIYLGNTATLTWDILNTAMGAMGQTDSGATVATTAGCYPNKIIMSPSSYHSMLKDADIVKLIEFAPHKAGDIGTGYEAAFKGTILGMDIIVSHMMYYNSYPSGERLSDIFLVDKENAGWFIQGVPLQVIDNPTPTEFAGRDIVVYTAYGTEVSQSKAVYRIVEKVASADYVQEV